MKMKSFLHDKSSNIELRKRILRCYVIPVVLYGMEAWKLTETLPKRINAIEMWTYRRMLRISWTDRIRNEEVHRRMNAQVELLFTIQKRKFEYFGHIMGGARYDLMQLIIQGKINSKRGHIRRNDSWLKNLRIWSGWTISRSSIKS